MRPAIPCTDIAPEPPPRPRVRLGFDPATVIVVCAIALTSLGLTVLFSASAAFKNKQGVEVPYQYLSKQIVGVVVATALAFAVSRLDLERLRRHVWVIGGAALLLLLLVLVPGLGIAVKGSRRWLGVGAMRFQVSEFAKLALVICLAHYLAVNQTRIGDLRRGFLLPLAIIGAFAGLILGEPDFGMAALTLAVGLGMLFLAGAKWRHLLTAVAVAVAGFTVLVIHNPNRLRRLTEFWEAEPPYQLKQALAAYAAGGVGGVGLGEGRQQLAYLPEAHTDFIFPVLGEELGLRATLVVVGVFALIFGVGLVHLRRAPNLYQFLLVAGALMFVAVQALINLLVVTGLVPPKGMSLPFLSAGLSNLLLMGLLVGLIINTRQAWPRAGLGRAPRTLEELA